MDDIEIPNGANVRVEGTKVTVSGPKGNSERDFSVRGLVITHSGSKIEVGKSEGSKIGLMMINTTKAHIRNMLIGATEGYSRKMQVIYSHFPMTLEVKGKVLLIKNFLGEKQPRTAKIIGQTKVEVKLPDVTLSGPNKEEVGETYSNIRTASKIRHRDPRVFQDGIYPVQE